MADDTATLTTMYDRFNARDIDGVLGALTDDVAWANGMTGGHVRGRGRGREGVREYGRANGPSSSRTSSP